MDREEAAAGGGNEVALAATGGKLYVVGGGIAGNAVPMIDEYDPGSDLWRSRAPMPKGLDHIGIAVIDGKIYTVGGFIGSVHRGAVSDVYRYDPDTDHWQTLAPMKSPRGAVGVTVLDGKIYAIGGRGIDNTFTVGTHEVYDPRPAHGTSLALCRRRAIISPLFRPMAGSTPLAAASPLRLTGLVSTTSTTPRTIRGRARRRYRPRAAGSPMRSTGV